MAHSPAPSSSSGDGGLKRQDALPIAARRHALIARIERRLRLRCGLDGRQGRAERLVVGVSGGADSTALLLAIAAIGSHSSAATGGAGIEPVAVHVHHHLRASADGDAAWVAELCARLGIEAWTEHVQPRDLPGNVPANARRLRYVALAAAARQAGAQYVAVAHHADDQLETMIMALGRGAGLEGLAGMPWRRTLEPGVWLVRPMLDSRRTECEDLCRAAGLEWREDPGNLDPRSARARVRHEVTPVLEALWPDAARRAEGLSDVLEAARQALEQRLAERFGAANLRHWDRAGLRTLELPLLTAGLRRAAMDEAPELGDEIAQHHLVQAAEAILDDETRPREFEWPDGLRLRVTSKVVELKRGP